MAKGGYMIDKKTGQKVPMSDINKHINSAIHSTTSAGRDEKYKKTGDRIPAGYDLAIMGNMTPQQQQLFSDSFQHLGPDSYTSRLARGDRSLFAEMEEPSMREFNELQGQTASRFSGMGQGGRRSSGFQNKMTQANRDFASQLAARRQELQRKAIEDLMGMSHTLLNEKYQDKALVEKPGSNKVQKTDWVSGAGGAVLGGVAGYLTGNTVGGAKAGWDVGKEIRKDKYGEF